MLKEGEQGLKLENRYDKHANKEHDHIDSALYNDCANKAAKRHFFRLVEGCTTSNLANTRNGKVCQISNK